MTAWPPRPRHRPGYGWIWTFTRVWMRSATVFWMPRSWIPSSSNARKVHMSRIRRTEYLHLTIRKGLKVVGEVCGCFWHNKENNTIHKKGNGCFTCCPFPIIVKYILFPFAQFLVIWWYCYYVVLVFVLHSATTIFSSTKTVCNAQLCRQNHRSRFWWRRRIGSKLEQRLVLPKYDIYVHFLRRNNRTTYPRPYCWER